MPIYKKIKEPKNFIASNLRYLLYIHKVRAMDLEKYIGSSQYAISNWKTGVAYPKVNSLQKLCAFFEVSLDDFISVDLSGVIYKESTAA